MDAHALSNFIKLFEKTKNKMQVFYFSNKFDKFNNIRAQMQDTSC